jgi:hypothetical protein
MLVNDMTESQSIFTRDSLGSKDTAGNILARKFQKCRADYPTMYSVCDRHLRKLLDGCVLSYSELVDLCTLRDDAIEVMGYRTSLEIIFRNTKDIQKINPILNRLWRRILLATE